MCTFFYSFHSIFFFRFSFIHQLKVQEAMRKKEKFQREHEEVSFLYFLSSVKAFFSHRHRCGTQIFFKVTENTTRFELNKMQD